jgi:predicted permease
MKYLNRLASMFGWIFHRSRAEARLDEELRTVIEMAAQDKIRAGVPPEVARRQARLELGGLEQVKEQVRERRHGHLVDEIGRDVRYAVRMFARTPGFAAVVILTLALGIGANTAIFSLLDALLLRSLPVRDPHGLVQINLRQRGSPSGGESFSYAIVRALDGRRDVFAGVAGFSSMGFDVWTQRAAANQAANDTVTRVSGALVTGGFYETLGLEPAAGRLLTRADDEPDAPLAAVISDAFWARQFGRRADAIGSTLDANGVSITVVGVTRRGFSGADVGSAADITMAVAALPRLRPSLKGLLESGNFWLRVLARPAAGLTNDDAAARLNALWPAMADVVIAPHWSATRRKAMAEHVFQFEPGATGWTYLRDIYRHPLYVLMTAVGVVLLIACVNIASLLLARAAARRQEIAVRLAIGAGRRRIVRQLLIESTLLSLAGAALGVGLAWTSSRVLVNIISSGPFDVVFDLTPNWRVLGFAAALGIATGMIFGLAPLRQITRDTSSALRQGERWATRRSRLLPSLVSVQVALAIVLLAGAGLFVRTLTNLRNLDPGFRTDDVFVVKLERRASPSPEELLGAVRRSPAVMYAGLTTHTPLDGATWSEPLVPAGQPIPERDNTHVIAADRPFFDAMRIALVAGRGFDDGDARGRSRVAIVNERFADTIFPNRNPIGERLVGPLMGKMTEIEIVGLVKNTSVAGLRRTPPPVVYVPFAQFEGGLEPSLAIRAAGPAGAVATAIREALQPRLPSTPIEVRALAQQVSGTIVRERMMATLASAFGLLALALASIGLYGLLAFNVAQRSREIGIRMALGSRASQVIAMVLGSGARLVLAGVVLGLPAAWTASRWIESMLFGLTPTDPLAAGGAIATLMFCAFVAAYLPARRAAQLDPVIVLKQD